MKTIRSKVLDSVVIRKPGFLMRHGITVCALALIGVFLLFFRGYLLMVKH